MASSFRLSFPLRYMAMVKAKVMAMVKVMVMVKATIALYILSYIVVCFNSLTWLASGSYLVSGVSGRAFRWVKWETDTILRLKVGAKWENMTSARRVVSGEVGKGNLYYILLYIYCLCLKDQNCNVFLLFNTSGADSSSLNS